MSKPASFSTGAARLLEAYAADPTPSTRVLIVTLFGDAIVPHAGEAWLGSLSRLLEPLGITDRLVRTSVRRLVAEGLLINRQEGRRSFYSVHPNARSTFWRAEQRIYRSYPPVWDGRWTLAIIDADTEADTRQAIRRRLGWMGFGALTPTVLASPTLQPEEIIEELDSHHRSLLVLTRSTVDGTAETISDDQIVERILPLARLKADYEDFIFRYGDLADSVVDARGIDAATAFAVRSLMVSDYRRIVLADPGLPDELVPAEWPERRAADVAARLYRSLVGPSDQQLAAACITSAGSLVLQPEAYANRFAR
ncbi:MAG: phenylacetic acid degradation operon negative regulatory protein PaaX [Actinobacteria bacterium]|nr:phenylacetic acid degradation operon negative regulatory protein PaaX [Actinomycetota bacterium]